MKWSFKIGSLFGIPIRVHYFFVLLVLLMSVLTALQAETDRIREGLIVAGAILTVFCMVVLHELGHSLVARRFRVRVKDIILLPIGGMARMLDIPRKPRQEFLIAIAGPLTSFALASLFFGLGRTFGWLKHDGYNFLIVINVMLGLFNLVPAFPMDGGRILRSLLARRYDFMRATRIAVRVAKIIAVLGGIIGFYFNIIWFVIIALFVFWGAGAEEKATILSFSLSGWTAGDAMLLNPLKLKTTTKVSELLRLMAGHLQDDFPVYDGRKLVGVLAEAVLYRVLRGTPLATIGDHMERRFFAVDPGVPLSLVYKRMTERKINVVPVMDGSRLLGLLSPGIILRYGRMFRR